MTCSQLVWFRSTSKIGFNFCLPEYLNIHPGSEDNEGEEKESLGFLEDEEDILGAFEFDEQTMDGILTGRETDRQIGLDNHKSFLLIISYVRAKNHHCRQR